MSTAGQCSPQPVDRRHAQAAQIAAEVERPVTQNVMRRERCKHGHWPQRFRRTLSRQVPDRSARLAEQENSRMHVAAVPCSVDQRPQRAGRFAVLRIPSQQTRADPEQDPAAQAQPVGDLLIPRERLQQRKPRVLEPGQLLAADSPAEELPRDRAQPRLTRRWVACIEFLQPLTPPGKADRTKRRIARRRNNVGQREVQVPERGKCGPNGRRYGGKRRQAVGIERPLSDR